MCSQLASSQTQLAEWGRSEGQGEGVLSSCSAQTSSQVINKPGPEFRYVELLICHDRSITAEFPWIRG